MGVGLTRGGTGKTAAWGEEGHLRAREEQEEQERRDYETVAPAPPPPISHRDSPSNNSNDISKSSKKGKINNKDIR